MLYCAHIVPVGTSLLANFTKSVEGFKVVEALGVSGWDKLAPDDLGQNVICSRFNELKSHLLEYVRVEGEKASAELSSLLRAVKGLNCKPDLTYVILYATNTCNSRLAMNVLVEYLEELGFNAEDKVIRSIRSEDELDEAMAEVVEKVLDDAVELNHRGYKVCINTTPGFKVESIYLTIAALIAGIDCIYYIHEAFKDIVYMPTPPLQLKEDYRKAITQLEKPIQRKEAEEKLGKTLLEELKIRKMVEEENNIIKAKQWIQKITELT